MCDTAKNSEVKVESRPAAGPFRRILVPVDESKQATWAVQYAGRLAQAFGARICLVHAYQLMAGYNPEFATPVEDVIANLKESGQATLQAAAELLRGVPVEQKLVEGEPDRQIVTAANDWKADLIVMGTHGRGRLAQFLLGSTAEGVIRLAHCPVMAVAHEPKASACCGECATKSAEAGEPKVITVGG